VHRQPVHAPAKRHEKGLMMADQTESSITIAASADAVMAVITDFEAYPDWNDEVKLVEILSVYEGTEQPAEVRFVLDAGAIKDDYVLEYEWVSDTELAWQLVKGDMLKAMDGVYRLTEVGDGTEVSYRLVVDVKIPMIGMIKRKAEKVIIDRALKGLKVRVEG
jgi:ribosome-associated toxin RatA of RatAB toxin-antitoxin module